MIRKLDDYSPTKEKYKIQKEKFLSNVKMFYSGRTIIIIEVENNKNPLPKKYVSNTYTYNEKEIDASEFGEMGIKMRVKNGANR